MDDRLRQELAAWLDFYRELGVEEFYRRSPAPKLETRNSKMETRQSEIETASGETKSRIPRAETPATNLSRPEAVEDLPGSAAPRVAAVGPSARSLSLFEAPPPLRPARETLEQIKADLGDCHRCRLANGRTTIVFGQGNPRAELVFVGEGPGADEDAQGLPFVGRAGQLLNRMLQFVGIKREDVYICNVVKCRPPGNRTPEKDEIETCSPFLFRQIEAIRPRLVCCLGDRKSVV
jgi:hypothetical protein